jgi:hypothetical protein
VPATCFGWKAKHQLFDLRSLFCLAVIVDKKLATRVESMLDTIRAILRQIAVRLCSASLWQSTGFPCGRDQSVK